MTIDSSSPTRYRAIGDVLKGEAERAANHLVVGATIVACVGVPISVSRAFSFGWSVVYGIHIGGVNLFDEAYTEPFARLPAHGRSLIASLSSTCPPTRFTA